MSLTTVMKEGGHWKGGSLVIARSNDLRNWIVGEVFYYPGNHGFPECSDIFRLGNYWYLLCSIFDKTCYRIGDSPLGPWRAGRTDSFDGVLNYAAKTISDGQNRYVMGWIRTKSNSKDGGAWEWAGHLSFPRQLVQSSDGTLYSRLPDQYKELQGRIQYRLKAGQDCVVRFGQWEKTRQGLLTCHSSLYSEVRFPGEYSVFDGTFEFTLDKGTKCGGVTVQSDPATNHPGYEIALDIRHQLLLFRKHGRHFGCYTCQDLGLEEEEPISLRVVLENGLIEVFVNDQYALASSFYHFRDNAEVCFFVEEGGARLTDARIYQLAERSAPMEIELESVVIPG